MIQCYEDRVLGHYPSPYHDQAKATQKYGGNWGLHACNKIVRLEKNKGKETASSVLRRGRSETRKLGKARPRNKRTHLVNPHPCLDLLSSPSSELEAEPPVGKSQDFWWHQY